VAFRFAVISFVEEVIIPGGRPPPAVRHASWADVGTDRGRWAGIGL